MNDEEAPNTPDGLGGIRSLFPFPEKDAILRGMRTAKWISLAVFAASISGLAACSDSESDKLNKPPTVFDPTEPDPRSDEQKVADFVVKLERKYKREEVRNSIDLHFVKAGSNRVKVRLTYDREADPTTVSSIADSAIELAKRLKREDPSVRDLSISFDRETVRRGE